VIHLLALSLIDFVLDVSHDIDSFLAELRDFLFGFVVHVEVELDVVGVLEKGAQHLPVPVVVMQELTPSILVFQEHPGHKGVEIGENQHLNHILVYFTEFTHQHVLELFV
jgi:hypothetical protein